MIDKYVGFTITVIIIAIVLWVASLYLPFYGFMQKRFKGACLGCILQPFISAIILALSFVVIFTYMTSDMIKYRKNAMVMVKKAPKDSTNVATHLYIGADDVCFLESGNLEVTAYSLVFDNDRDIALYDVIYVDSSTISVDDKYLIKFDFKNRKAIATEYEDTIEVADVKWDKVDAYFKKNNSK